MAFCPNCGKEVSENTKFCPECGYNFASGNSGVGASEKKGGSDFFKKLFDTRDMSDNYIGEEKNKFFAIISYIGFLFLIPMFCDKKNGWVQHHVQQGMLLFVADGAVYLAIHVLFGWFFSSCAVLNWLQVLGNIFYYLIYYCAFVVPSVGLAVYGIIMAAKGKAKELPLIGRFRITRE